jgi:hypothetical protein
MAQFHSNGAAAIAVAPISERDLDAAINDRVRRTAAPHPADHTRCDIESSLENATQSLFAAEQ